jgi:hypothetical protein
MKPELFLDIATSVAKDDIPGYSKELAFCSRVIGHLRVVAPEISDSVAILIGLPYLTRTEMSKSFPSKES